ncbi:hypothetical protein HMPREF9714_00960 [Myroides odoratimimus CCUG 12901]|uniref:hypothetical protein n=1 Tax=Myroides TaxID=76831 RepID=UPI0002460D54|nr:MULTISPECIES: hypothetical protein [Myroides]EHO13126.1 hypothetical protein HMPREF9714_00960 [Myroides odoratimimus CCUG 12901]MDX4974111.1 hypothetical protein [Myroides odoratimimus]
MKRRNIKRISIEESLDYFQKNGLDVTKEEASEILDFLYILITIVFREYFDRE